MAKPIAGIDQYPYGPDGIKISSVSNGSTTKYNDAYINKQVSTSKYRLKDKSTPLDDLIKDVTKYGKRAASMAIEHKGLDITASDIDISMILPIGSFCIRVLDKDANTVGFAVEFTENKIVINTPLRGVITDDCIVTSTYSVGSDNNKGEYQIFDSNVILSSQYRFSSSSSDYHVFGIEFTGNLKVILKCNSEDGISPELISGRIGEFSKGKWMRYEADVASLSGICDSSWSGIIGRYYKDDKEIIIDMGILDIWKEPLSWS